MENLPKQTEKPHSRTTDDLLEGAKVCQTLIHEIQAFLGISPPPPSEGVEHGPGINGRMQHLHELTSINLADLRHIHEFLQYL